MDFKNKLMNKNASLSDAEQFLDSFLDCTCTKLGVTMVKFEMEDAEITATFACKGVEKDVVFLFNDKSVSINGTLYGYENLWMATPEISILFWDQLSDSIAKFTELAGANGWDKTPVSSL